MWWPKPIGTEEHVSKPILAFLIGCSIESNWIILHHYIGFV